MLQEREGEVTRSVLRCVSAAPWEQSEDRSNNGSPSQIWTPLWERISEAPGKPGGCDCSLWSVGWGGVIGCAPCKLFLFLSGTEVQSNILSGRAGDSVVSATGTMEPPVCLEGTTSSIRLHINI